MATNTPVSPTAVDVTVFHGPSVRENRRELTSELADFPVLSVAAVEPLSALGARGGDRPALVFSNSPPPTTVPDRSTVWITTDAAVATAVADDAAVVHWGLGDDPDLLAVRLADELDGDDAVGTTAAGTALGRLEDAVLALDTDHRLTYLNEAAAALFRSPSAELLGETVWEHTPGDVETAVRPAVEDALSSGEPVTTSIEPPATDGVALFEVEIHPGEGGVTLHSHDPESGSTLSLYEYLVRTVGDAVYILDDEGRFVFVNDALCEMTGYGRDELLGSSVHIIKDDETVTAAEDALRDLLRTRGDGTTDADSIDIAKLDVELVRDDGERVPCTDRMTLRPLDDGEFTGTVGTLRDISRQHRRQELLNGIIERSRTMMTATDTRAVAEVVVSTAVDVFDLDLAVLRKYDPEREALVPMVESTAAADVLGERPVYGSEQGPAGTAFTEGELVVEENLSAAAGTEVTDLEYGAYLPIGDGYVLSLGDSTDDSFDDVTLGLLEVFGETAAAAFDRVHREEHLRQYEAVVEAAEEMLFTIDDEHRFTLVTRPFARMLGYERTELVGRRLDEFLPDTAAGEAVSSSHRAVLETRLSGTEGTVPARLVLTSFEGGFVGTVRDISQLKSAQREASRQRQRFLELFETLSDPVADLAYGDGGATLESINPAFATLCGRDTDRLQSEPFETARDAMPAGLAEALDPVREPGPSLDTTVTVQTSSGERHYILRTAPYESDGTERAFVLLADVTEVTRRGTQLKVLHRLLRHNLRNETAIIKGHAEQLRQLGLPPGADDHIAHILDASDELVGASETSKTVQRLLGFDDEDVELVSAEEAIDRLRSDIAGDLSHPETSLTLDAETDERMPFSRYLLVALRELVENAVEHEPASSVEVSATAVENGVELSVSDDGTGIPQSQWELLTGDREITQLQHTDGLGLWLVKWVTDRHSGRLRLEQSGADGTTVSLVFPTDDRT